jgi:probable HAF family extracellular repeat protein
MRASTVWSVACCAAILFGAGSGLITASEFIALGQPSASAVSADGSVVVGTSDGSAWRWTAETGFQQLTDEDGDVIFHARGVSSDGSVIVGWVGDWESREAAKWSDESGIVRLGLPGGALSSASGVSDDGSVIAGYSYSTDPVVQAFRWTAANGIELLGVPEGFTRSMAGGVSADGSIITVRTDILQGDDNDWGAWLWTDESELEYLGQGLITDMTPDGSVVVGYFAPSSPLDGHNFRWTRETGMAILPFDTDTFYAECSPDGSVIYGPKMHYQDNLGAFMWDEENGIRDFRDVLISNYGLASELEGWQLDRVNDTSRDGRTLVGRGSNPAGDREAWIAVLDPVGDMNGDGEVNGLDCRPVCRSASQRPIPGRSRHES